jgi:L-ribulose-5-phosphate 3-epimerase
VAGAVGFSALRRGRAVRRGGAREDPAAGSAPALAERDVARHPEIRLAGHTYPYRDRPLEDALDQLASLGLSSIDLWLGHAGAGRAAVSRALRERGLEAAAVSAGGVYSAESDVASRAFELAEALGAQVVVACISPELLDGVIDDAPPGVTLCVENHWDHELATARDLKRAIDGRHGMSACVDTGHAILAGETPERFVADLEGRIGHVHLKDAAFPPLRQRVMGRRLRTRLLSRPKPVFPGTGALDIGGVRGALEGIRFQGAVAVEFEGSEPTAALERILAGWTSSGGVPSGVS